MLVTVLGLTLLAPAAARAIVPGTPDASGPNVNGRVNAIVRLGDTIYIGGTFNTVNGQPRSGLAAFNAADGSLTSWAPVPNGDVNAMVGAGSTLYIGGLFTTVTDSGGPKTRNAVAAVDTSGNVTAWDPNAGGLGQVWALAIAGSRVYIGGQFTTLGTGGSQITETNLGVVDASSGIPVGWSVNPPNPNNDVLSLEPSPDGTIVYVGGDFGQIGQPVAQNRLGVAAVQASNGAVDAAWNPSDPGNGSGAIDFAIAPSGNVYIVGDFFGNPSMGFAPREFVAELQPAGGGRTGVATSFAPDTDAQAESIAVGPDAVYVGGFFNQINTKRTPAVRNGLAAVDAGLGDVVGWNPSPGTQVVSLLVASDGSLYAGGTFNGGFLSFSPPPAATTDPAIQGTPQPSQTLTCTQGTWSGAVPQTYTGQILYDGAPVGPAGVSTYTVADADVGHTIGCTVTAHNRRADVTAAAPPVTIQAGPSASPLVTPPLTVLPAPVFRKTANLFPVKGTVLVRLPGSSKAVPISVPAQIPFGSIIDARHGTVRVCTADRKAKVSCSDFYGGVFKLTQLAGAVPITVLTLVGGNFKVCKRTPARRAPTTVHTSKQTTKLKTKSVRHLWGTGTGPFRTVGRYASATIRGTTWLTDDRCDGTLIRVKAGAVTVRDLVRAKSVVLKAPKRYLAQAGKRRR